MNAKTKNTNAKTLKEWYDNLPAKDQIQKRDEVVSACGITVKTFYSWLRGDHIPKIGMQNAIVKVTKIDIHFTTNADLMAEKLPFVQ